MSVLSPALEKIIERAHHFARHAQHEYLTVEHLLSALLEEEALQHVLKELGVNIEAVRNDLYLHLIDFCPRRQRKDDQPVTTRAFQRVIKLSVLQAQELLHPQTDMWHVLTTIVREQDAYAAYFLRKHHLDRERLAKVIHQQRERELKKKKQQQEEVKKQQAKRQKQEKTQEALLGRLTLELVAEAQAGRIDPLIGREAELKRLVEILHRRRKSNPIVVGQAGVGKSALVEGLALAIAERQDWLPEALHDYRIHQLKTGHLLAGTRYRGDLEERLTKILEELKDHPKALLFIDDMHTIIGAGGSNENPVDITSLMLPAMQRGELRVLGTILDQEYRKTFEKQSALARRFQRIDLAEPSREENIAILEGLIEHYADFHQLTYQPEALSVAVDLSQRYLSERALPDAAIDLLDEAGAVARLRGAKRVHSSDLVQLVAKQARVPSQQLNQDEKERLRQLESALMANVYGQTAAIQALVSALKLSSAGLRSNHKTMGSFLFAGPTGVGKTELCRQLAQHLAMPLLRFDMSEYMEAHSVSKLIGTAPGYVGYEEEGLLARQILQHPYSVLLLDEVEKAHPDVMNILLQIMDRGGFTDHNGREIDCRHLLLVLTSNVGAFELEKNSIGFIQQGDRSQAVEEALKRHFTPEFRNRLDKIIRFNPLDEAQLLRVVDKFLAELEALLRAKKMVLCVDRACRQWLAEQGYDPKMGARPMARVIEQYLKEPLAELMLFGEALPVRVEVRLLDGLPRLQPYYSSQDCHQPEYAQQQ